MHTVPRHCGLISEHFEWAVCLIEQAHDDVSGEPLLHVISLPHRFESQFRAGAQDFAAELVVSPSLGVVNSVLFLSTKK